MQSQFERPMRPEANYASLPYVITAGDPLQFPPVPATSSLLAEPDGQTKEHRVAQSMFEDQGYVLGTQDYPAIPWRFSSDEHLVQNAHTG